MSSAPKKVEDKLEELEDKIKVAENAFGLNLETTLTCGFNLINIAAQGLWQNKRLALIDERTGIADVMLELNADGTVTAHILDAESTLKLA